MYSPLGTHSHAAMLPYVDTDWIKAILTEIDCLYGVNSLPPTTVSPYGLPIVTVYYIAFYITSRITPRGGKLEVIYRTNQTYSLHIHLLPYVDTDWIKSILTEIDCLYGVNSLPPTISIRAAYCHCVLHSVLYNLQDYALGLKAGDYI